VQITRVKGYFTATITSVSVLHSSQHKLILKKFIAKTTREWNPFLFLSTTTTLSTSITFEILIKTFKCQIMRRRKHSMFLREPNTTNGQWYPYHFIIHAAITSIYTVYAQRSLSNFNWVGSFPSFPNPISETTRMNK